MLNLRLKIQKTSVECRIYDSRIKKQALNLKSTIVDFKKETVFFIMLLLEIALFI